MNSDTEMESNHEVRAEASKWNRASLIVMSLGAFVSFFLAWRCVQMLDVDGDPVVISAEFASMQSLLTWSVLIVFGLLLFVQSQAFLQRAASGQVFLYGWLYLVLCTGVDYVWLSEEIFQYTKATDTWSGGFNAMAFVGLAQALAGGFLSFVAYFIVRARRTPLTR